MPLSGDSEVSQNTFFFLNDLFLYLAIDTVFHPSGIFKMAWKFLQNYMFKDGVKIIIVCFNHIFFICRSRGLCLCRSPWYCGHWNFLTYWKQISRMVQQNCGGIFQTVFPQNLRKWGSNQYSLCYSTRPKAAFWIVFCVSFYKIQLWRNWNIKSMESNPKRYRNITIICNSIWNYKFQIIVKRNIINIFWMRNIKLWVLIEGGLILENLHIQKIGAKLLSREPKKALMEPNWKCFWD